MWHSAPERKLLQSKAWLQKVVAVCEGKSSQVAPFLCSNQGSVTGLLAACFVLAFVISHEWVVEDRSWKNSKQSEEVVCVLCTAANRDGCSLSAKTTIIKKPPRRRHSSLQEKDGRFECCSPCILCSPLLTEPSQRRQPQQQQHSQSTGRLIQTCQVRAGSGKMTAQRLSWNIPRTPHHPETGTTCPTLRTSPPGMN